MTGQEPLLTVYTVHCFLTPRGCHHVVRAVTPLGAHEQMETHYQEAHTAWIAATAGTIRGEPVG